MKNICLAIGIAAITLSSCAERVVVAERPAPPAYARPAVPGPHYVWVDGDWYVHNRKYVWREGYWAPTGGKHWVGGHWVHRRHGWYWQQGRWR